MSHGFALGLIGAGISVTVLSTLGALAIGADQMKRLHFLTPITSLGSPLIGVGLCVENGWGIETGEILLIVGFLFVTGPVVSSATGRLIAQNEGRIPAETPE